MGEKMSAESVSKRVKKNHSTLLPPAGLRPAVPAAPAAPARLSHTPPLTTLSTHTADPGPGQAAAEAGPDAAAGRAGAGGRDEKNNL